MRRRGLAWTGVLVSLVVLVPRAAAEHRVGHEAPAAAAVQHFPDDFTPPDDGEWGWALGGFRGATVPGGDDHLPVILVHGNNTDHATWYPVAARLAELGWDTGDLWALSYNGVGCTNDGALYTRNEGHNGWTYEDDRSGSDGCVVTSNDVNVPDLKAFIDAVLDYTGTEQVHIVAHSLGVTLARKTLLEHDFYDAVDGFVAIAGANHGTSFCPPGSEEVVNSCDEIAAGTDWLEDLNDADGAGETPEPTRWMTVYDGTGLGDPAFAGPTYADSPRLEGADANCTYPGFYHNDLRVDPRIVADYAAFLEAVEDNRGFVCPGSLLPIPPQSE